MVPHNEWSLSTTQKHGMPTKYETSASWNNHRIPEMQITISCISISMNGVFGGLLGGAQRQTSQPTNDSRHRTQFPISYCCRAQLVSNDKNQCLHLSQLAITSENLERKLWWNSLPLSIFLVRSTNQQQQQAMNSFVFDRQSCESSLAIKQFAFVDGKAATFENDYCLYNTFPIWLVWALS